VGQTTRGDGGYRVFVDDDLVIDNWTVGKPLVSHLRVQLTAGPHRIRLEQFRRAEWGGPTSRLGIIHEDELVDDAARKLAAQADVVVAAVGFDKESEGEASDRTFALPVGQDELIQALRAVNPRTIVVLTSGGGADMTGWVERVPAVVQAWYPGQDGGTALAQLLFGDANFSGRLPATFERRLEDNPSLDSYYPAPGTTRVVYKNGVCVGYRGYQQHKRQPLFPFGYGLSYTKFAYSDLRVRARGDDVKVSLDVKNIGAREGADVAQIYVAEMQPTLPRPPLELRGFEKVSLKAGESKTVTISLTNRAFSFWDVNTHQWRANRGVFEILLGTSSANFPLKTTLKR
jgi:beta-glucosidase